MSCGCSFLFQTNSLTKAKEADVPELFPGWLYWALLSDSRSGEMFSGWTSWAEEGTRLLRQGKRSSIQTRKSLGAWTTWESPLLLLVWPADWYPPCLHSVSVLVPLLTNKSTASVMGRAPSSRALQSWAWKKAWTLTEGLKPTRGTLTGCCLRSTTIM